MKFTAKIYWPESMVTLTETSFEALGLAVGQYLDEHYRLAPVRVEFEMVLA
jgi:hypothetical protein